MSEIHVKGLADLQKFMDTLAPKVEANVMRGALRAGMKPILAAAKSGAAVSSGVLRDGLKITTKKRYGKVTASVVSLGKHGYLARWLEFGTRPHTITAKKGGALLIAGSTFITSVEHPGSRPHPFLRPALDSRAQEAVVAAGNYIKKRLATKHGLDTAGITIEGDQ